MELRNGAIRLARDVDVDRIGDLSFESSQLVTVSVFLHPRLIEVNLHHSVCTSCTDFNVSWGEHRRTGPALGFGARRRPIAVLRHSHNVA